MYPSRHPSGSSSKLRRSSSAACFKSNIRFSLQDMEFQNIDGESLCDVNSERTVGWKSVKKGGVSTMSAPEGKIDGVRRWDGAARGSTEWDALKRDPELWYPDGNCLVHLYGQGQSRRGPAFRLHFSVLMKANCRPLFKDYLDQGFIKGSSNSSEMSSHISPVWADGEFWEEPSPSGLYELYIPAPAHLERDQTFLYHIATRNFFAWIYRKPLVGSHLGGALVGLLNIMAEYRSPEEDNVQDILDFIDEEGYSDMKNHPDHALAILFLSEHFRWKGLWIDAFAHCVGMNHKIMHSSEFESITPVSRALVSRARMEMDFRLHRCGKSLSNFCEAELLPANLGISQLARDQLDLFRNILQSYYVVQFGYYPPPSPAKNKSFSKEVLRTMRQEFEDLYAFLVDENSTTETESTQSDGGISVLQLLLVVDRRQRYRNLPHMLPLVPDVIELPAPVPLHKRLSLGSKYALTEMKAVKTATVNAHKAATNWPKLGLLPSSHIVRAYLNFEKELIDSNLPTDGKSKANKNVLSLADGRRVRWILIYTMLQTLRSCTDIPYEVTDTENCTYNLCVQTAGCPPWDGETKETIEIPSTFLPTRQPTNKRLSTISKQSAPRGPTPDMDFHLPYMSSSELRSKNGLKPLSLVDSKTLEILPPLPPPAFSFMSATSHKTGSKPVTLSDSTSKPIAPPLPSPAFSFMSTASATSSSSSSRGGTRSNRLSTLLENPTSNPTHNQSLSHPPSHKKKGSIRNALASLNAAPVATHPVFRDLVLAPPVVPQGSSMYGSSRPSTSYGSSGHSTASLGRPSTASVSRPNTASRSYCEIVLPVYGNGLHHISSRSLSSGSFEQKPLPSVPAENTQVSYEATIPRGTGRVVSDGSDHSRASRGSLSSRWSRSDDGRTSQHSSGSRSDVQSVHAPDSGFASMLREEEIKEVVEEEMSLAELLERHLTRRLGLDEVEVEVGSVLGELKLASLRPGRPRSIY